MNDPYMPSNGTEGEWFLSIWCKNCQKDTLIRGGKKQCSILTKSLIGEQPKQWMYLRDVPACTSFKHIKDKKRYAIKIKGQLDIFNP